MPEFESRGLENRRMSKLVLTQLLGIPLINPHDDLVELLSAALIGNGLSLIDGDILVLAQKIVSKSEGRLVNLNSVVPSERAQEIAMECGKRPELVELILSESREISRIRTGTLICEHRLGFLCANAGIDHSNVQGTYGDPADWVLLLPEDPDRSARAIQDGLQTSFNCRIGILIADSHGRAWRNGSIGMTIGLAGLPGIVDQRGEKDIFGHTLRATQMAVADELAACASLMMGEAAERIPAIHVRGFPHQLRASNINELIRPKEYDLFR